MRALVHARNTTQPGTLPGPTRVSLRPSPPLLVNVIGMVMPMSVDGMIPIARKWMEMAGLLLMHVE